MELEIQTQMGVKATPDPEGGSKLEKLCAEIDQIDIELIENKKRVDKDYENFFSIQVSSFFDDGFIQECLFLCIYPWPGYDQIISMKQLAPAAVNHVEYFLTDLLIIVMFFRFHGVIRHLERYHEFTDIYSKQVCKTVYNFIPSRLFSIKIELIENPSRMAIILFSVSILILAQILRIFELPYEYNSQVGTNDLHDFGSAIWLIVITSTTVGYGDIYPHTIGGQFTCIIAAFWGTFIVSLLVLIIS